MKPDSKKKKKTSVKWIFFGYCIALVVFMLAIVWILRLAFVDSTYKRVKLYIAESTTKEITKGIEENKNVNDIATDIAKNSDISVVLLDGQGVIRVQKKSNMMGYEPKQSDLMDIRNMAINSDKGTYWEPINIAGDDGKQKMIIYSQSVELGSYIEGVGPINSGTGTIILTCTIAPLTPTLKTINFELLIVSAIMIVAAFLFAFLLARHVSKPLVDINNKSKVLAKGDYSVHFNEGGYKEVSELGETLNYTADELGKTDRMRRDLIANVSHDLRTPLTMIRGYAEMMRDMPNENNSDNMNVIIKETDYLTNLVKDMLDISKLDSNKVEFKITRFDLNELIVSVVDRYNALYKSQEYTFEYQPLDSKVYIKSDKVMITNVLYNLMNNAVNHIGDDKKITLKAEIDESKTRIVVHVIDRGEGIDEKVINTIWDRYYKAERSLKRESAGSGLGLSIVKTVLTKLNAGYGVTSKVGEGSDFYIDLMVDAIEPMQDEEPLT